MHPCRFVVQLPRAGLSEMPVLVRTSGAGDGPSFRRDPSRADAGFVFDATVPGLDILPVYHSTFLDDCSQLRAHILDLLGKLEGAAASPKTGSAGQRQLSSPPMAFLDGASSVDVSSSPSLSGVSGPAGGLPPTPPLRAPTGSERGDMAPQCTPDEPSSCEVSAVLCPANSAEFAATAFQEQEARSTLSFSREPSRGRAVPSRRSDLSDPSIGDIVTLIDRAQVARSLDTVSELVGSHT